MKLTLMGPDDDGCWFLCDEDGRDWRVVTHWKDHAYAASLFGWVACDCCEADGTVDCEHRTAKEMIAEAREFLMEHNGEEIEPPRQIAAYFEEMDKEEE